MPEDGPAPADALGRHRPPPSHYRGSLRGSRLVELRRVEADDPARWPRVAPEFEPVIEFAALPARNVAVGVVGASVVTSLLPLVVAWLYTPLLPGGQVTPPWSVPITTVSLTVLWWCWFAPLPRTVVAGGNWVGCRAAVGRWRGPVRLDALRRARVRGPRAAPVLELDDGAATVRLPGRIVGRSPRLLGLVAAGLRSAQGDGVPLDPRIADFLELDPEPDADEPVPLAVGDDTFVAIRAVRLDPMRPPARLPGPRDDPPREMVRTDLYAMLGHAVTEATAYFLGLGIIVFCGFAALVFVVEVVGLGDSVLRVLDELAVLVGCLGFPVCLVDGVVTIRRRWFPPVVAGRRWLAVRTRRRWRTVDLDAVTDAGINGDVAWLADDRTLVSFSIGAVARNPALLATVTDAGARAGSTTLKAQTWRSRRPGPLAGA